jgi:hypothetical protein
MSLSVREVLSQKELLRQQVFTFLETIARVTAFTSVMLFAIYTVDSVYGKYCDVETADIQAKADESSFAGTLGGCATDTECMMAEDAAVKAVAQERQLASYGGGGRELAKAGRLSR